MGAQLVLLESWGLQLSNYNASRYTSTCCARGKWVKKSTSNRVSAIMAVFRGEVSKPARKTSCGGKPEIRQMFCRSFFFQLSNARDAPDAWPFARDNCGIDCCSSMPSFPLIWHNSRPTASFRMVHVAVRRSCPCDSQVRSLAENIVERSPLQAFAPRKLQEQFRRRLEIMSTGKRWMVNKKKYVDERASVRWRICHMHPTYPPPLIALHFCVDCNIGREKDDKNAVESATCSKRGEQLLYTYLDAGSSFCFQAGLFI